MITVMEPQGRSWPVVASWERMANIKEMWFSGGGVKVNPARLHVQMCRLPCGICYVSWANPKVNPFFPSEPHIIILS